MKKPILLIVIALAILAGVMYFFFSGNEYVIRLNENQIREKLNKKLPRTKTYLLIFQVTLENPRVFLIDGRNRVDAALDTILNIKMGKKAKLLDGSIDISGGIKYLPEKGQFFLTDPVVEDLKVKGIPEKYAEKVNKILSKVLIKYYEDHPIYTLKQSKVKQAAAKLVLKDVYIENQELVLILGV